MSDAAASLPHVLSVLAAIPQPATLSLAPVLLRMPQLAGPLGSSHTALVLATSLIHPFGKSDRRTTGVTPRHRCRLP
jgi:hypothetical protein